jgi:hypothetical protein
VEKKCFRCHAVKPLVEFYRHTQMADGHLNKCKECTKTDVRVHYRRDLEWSRAKERMRFHAPDRKAWIKENQPKARKRNPQKYRARSAVARAIRSGSLVRQSCEVCGNAKSEAHHPDYSRPLDVKWLCRKHHRIEHGAYIQT